MATRSTRPAEHGRKAHGGFTLVEVLVSVSILILATGLDLVYVLHQTSDRDRLGLYFRTERWAGAIENREPEKCAGWDWFEVTDLPDRIVPYCAHALGRIHAGERFGLFGWP